MGTPQVASRAMEDELRRLQLRIDALERRMPTGESIPFDPLLTPGGNFPTMTTYAEYIRMNRLVSHHLRFVTTSISTLGAGVMWTIKPPHDFDFAAGTWNLRHVTGPSSTKVVASGVVAEADAAVYGAGRVALFPIYLGSWDAWSLYSDRLVGVDFDDAFGAFAMSGMTRTWFSGEIVEVNFTTRVPDGS